MVMVLSAEIAIDAGDIYLGSSVFFWSRLQLGSENGLLVSHGGLQVYVIECALLQSVG